MPAAGAKGVREWYTVDMKEKRLKGSVKGAIIGFIAAAIVIGAIALGMNRPSPKTAITSTTLKSSLEQASDLITTKYYYSSVGRFDNSYEINGWSIPFTGKNFLLTYQGEAMLGFSTEELQVDMRGDTITVTCPPISVLSNSIPSETVEVYDQSHNIFNPVTISDYLNFETEQKRQAEAKMQENGTFDKAREDAEKAIRQLLDMIPEIRENYTVEVHFQPQPEVPDQSASLADPSSSVSQNS